MQKKVFGKTGLEVSTVGLGTWAIGGDYFGRVDDTESIKTIRKALDCEINLIDTSPAYGGGHAEEVIGRAIKGRRNEAIITDKCGTKRVDGKFLRDLRPETVRQEIDRSLSLLGVEYIDIYLLHWPDVNTPVEETAAELLKLKKAGKFKHFGVSNYDIKTIEAISKIIDVECIQSQCSIMFRDRLDIIDYCNKNNMGVMTYGSLAGGLLSGKFTARPQFGEADTRSTFYPFFREDQWDKSMKFVKELNILAEKYDKPLSHVAINWVNQQTAVASALVGAKTPAQIEENAASADWRLASEDIAFINMAYERFF